MIKLLAVLLPSWVLIACTQSNALELQGRIAMKGTATHSYLVIEDAVTNKPYKIQNQRFQDLVNKQRHIVKIKANLLKEAVGPGFPAVIEVLEVKEVE